MEQSTVFSPPAPDRMAALAAEARKGDAQAFAQLARECERTLYRVSHAVLMNDADCADAVQEALTIAWQRLPGLREPRYFRTWLIRILLNQCYRMAKRGRRETQLAEYNCLLCETPREELMDLREALAALPPPQRAVLVLFHAEDLPVEEVARILRVPAGTVKSRLARARAKLAERLRQKEEP